MNTLKLHHEILDEARKNLLERLIPYTKGFVLSGGTALSLQIGHRKSFDFDFFSQEEISKILLEKISKVFSINNVSVDSTDELTIFDKDMIKITFLFYPFKPYFDGITLDSGLRIAPIKEIAVGKAYTIGRRGEYRDYFDLYTIFEKKLVSLDEVIDIAEKKYTNVFNSKLFLQQLVYFNDLLNFDIISSAQSLLPAPDEVKKYLENEVNEYLKKSL